MTPNKRDVAAKRKSGSRQTRAESKRKASKKTMPTKLVKTKTPKQSQQKSAGVNRAEGIAMFKLAGRPTKEQFALVYGPKGPSMTWEQRGAAGVRAEEFQRALAEKATSRRTPAR